MRKLHHLVLATLLGSMLSSLALAQDAFVGRPDEKLAEHAFVFRFRVALRRTQERVVIAVEVSRATVGQRTFSLVNCG